MPLSAWRPSQRWLGPSPVNGAALAAALAVTLATALLGCGPSSPAHPRRVRHVDPYQLALGAPGPPHRLLSVSPGRILESKSGRPVSLEQLVTALMPQRVVFVGEQHDHRAHHEAQLQLIRAWEARLAPRGQKLGIGLEMFPRAQQGVLDDWVAGRIPTERAFVKRIAWYRQWGFDYRYYRGIIRLARARRLPLIALNAPRAIVRKIGRRGVTGLTAAERGSLPALFLGSKRHRRLFWAMMAPLMGGHGRGHSKGHRRGGAARHAARRIPVLERYYQAQVTWDETMADSVRRALLSAPLGMQRMVVLAGNGHVAFGLGINLRLRRHNPTLAQASVVCVANSKGRAVRRVSNSLADYLWGAAHGGCQQQYPKLGVFTSPNTGSDPGLLVRGIGRRAKAWRRAGIRRGDVLVEAGGRPLREALDLRLIWQQKTWGEQLDLRLLRAGKPLRISLALPTCPGAPATP